MVFYFVLQVSFLSYFEPNQIVSRSTFKVIFFLQYFFFQLHDITVNYKGNPKNCCWSLRYAFANNRFWINPSTLWLFFGVAWILNGFFNDFTLILLCTICTIQIIISRSSISHHAFRCFLSSMLLGMYFATRPENQVMCDGQRYVFLSNGRTVSSVLFPYVLRD